MAQQKGALRVDPEEPEDEGEAVLPMIDPMLQLFVRVMNRSLTQCGISLLVGGTWVSGRLITPRMYTTELGHEAVTTAGQAAEGFHIFFDEVGGAWFPSESERAATTGGAEPEEVGPYYLHLRQARVFTGGGPIPEDGFYMRIRLDQVAGWAIGELGPPGYQSAGPPPAPGEL